MQRLITAPRLFLAALVAVPLATALAFGGPHGPFHGPPTAEQARAHAGRAADYVLWQLDGTEQQKATIAKELDQVVPTLHNLHEEGHDLRAELRGLLAEETLDLAALEGVRKDAVALFDRGTSIALRSVVAMASTLTPEQRAELADLQPPPHPSHGE